MSTPCRILLVCDEPEAGAELRRLLGAELRATPVLGQGEMRILTLTVEVVVLTGTWELGLRDRRYHLGIIAVTAASPMAELIRHPTVSESLAAILHLMPAGGGASQGPVLRPGRDRVLELPCTSMAVLREVERLLLAVMAQEAAPDGDARILSLLRGFIASGDRSIAPHFGVDDPDGWSYPRLVSQAPPGPAQGQLLDRLVEHGVCERSVARRVRVCPTCTSHQLSYGECCVRCGSFDFVRETIIHHFACAHMDTQQAFIQGDALVCPKCRVTLRQIGRDYEKPSNCYQCRSCAHIAAETRIAALCLRCHTEVAPEQTAERLVYAYALTAKADEAVAAEDLGGHDMASVLRNQGTGLYAKRFFIFSIAHELERMHRYGHPLALVMLRSHRLIELRSGRLDLYDTYARALWQAASEGLRTLDMACVWAEGTLAIMLPATPLEGAEVVLQRIAQRLDATRSGPTAEQEVVLACLAANPRHTEAEALMQDALAALEPSQEPTPNDMLVLADDEGILDGAGGDRARG